MTHWRRLAGMTGLVVTGACIDITVDGDAIGSLEFVPPAYPSIDAGDELRDTLGQITSLKARVFRANGDPDTTAEVTFTLLRSTGARVDGNRLIADTLRGDTASRTITLFAATGGLQSQSKTLTIVRSPTLFVVDGDSNVSINYRLFPAANDNGSDLKTSLRFAQALNAAVPGYITRFRILRGTTRLPTTDTTQSYFLLDGSGRPSDLDTTAAAGDASRRLVFRRRAGQPDRDSSVVVVAEIRPARPNQPPRQVRWRIRVQPAS